MPETRSDWRERLAGEPRRPLPESAGLVITAALSKPLTAAVRERTQQQTRRRRRSTS